jgi:hypothetical protein
MTKLRAPLSIDAALARIAGHLPGGWDDMAKAAGRQAHTIRAWGDPEKPDAIPLPCAIALDVAFRSAGGHGAPLFDAYEALLDQALSDQFADQHELAHVTANAIKEVGQAESALIIAALPGATDEQIAAAEREAEEGLAALNTAANTVKRLRKKRRTKPATAPP